jgi:hypothetical protein
MGDPFNCSCSTTVAVDEIAVIVALNLTTPLLCGQWVSLFPTIERVILGVTATYAMIAVARNID